ncbi:Riboflavin transporter [Granulosicoccus antarcticus IMCC3135]|uniref:Riboflavin transporter n=2 Tax=Granulosicoccus TaxID=437504 RepID=A0A2Z2NK76_9GAMM|nr:Riboflavin transporter [Granulosicoccus antarcticus IMCC3135]
MLLAFLCFAVMDTSAKWLVAATIPALQVAWLRYLGHFLCAILLYGPGHGVGIVRSNKPWLQSLRAVFLLAGTCLNFSALKFLPLTTAIAIFFVSPLTVCLLSIPILGEKVGIKRLMAVLVGFIGVLIIVKPWSQSFNPAIFLSMGAMLCVSCYFVMSRVIAGVDSNATAQFYVSGIATLILAPVALMNWVWPTSTTAWVLVVLIGTLGMVGHSFLTNAHRYAEASVLAPTVYAQIIYIAALSWLVFNQTPDLNTLVGTFIIVCSGLFIWFRERQVEASTTPVSAR